MLPLDRFAADEAALEEALRTAKLRSCPGCGLTGTLVGHGYLYGYAEREGGRVVRGRRFLCSNRFRRPGCGRTFSVLLAYVLLGFVVRTPTLWSFLRAVVAGASRRAAWLAAAAGALSISTGYRLWKRLGRAQVGIRTWLCRGYPPPASSVSLPMAQMVTHFEHVFPAHACPMTAFQSRWQRALLGDPLPRTSRGPPALSS
jgi:hypothetical protein